MKTWTLSKFLPFGKNRDHSLLLEIFEISRNARMIMDENNNLILSNSKFDTLCTPFGQPSYESLILFFGGTDEIRKRFSHLSSEARKGEINKVEMGHDFEGQGSWYRITAQPVNTWKGYVHWRLDDLTTEHEQQRRLNEEHTKLTDYTDNAPVGFFSVNEKGRFEFVNATFARWVGKNVDDLLSSGYLHDFLVAPPEDGAPYDIKENGGVRQIADVRMKGKGGREFLAAITQTVVHEGNGMVRTRAVVNDLSSEQAIREALHASESRFRQFFEEAPVGIAIVNKDLNVKACNLTLAKMQGKKIPQVEQFSFNDMIDFGDWPTVTDILTRIKNGETIKDPIEVRVWNIKQQNSSPCQMYARLFSDGENIAVHFLDLSQQKNLESQFIQSQKMQAVGQLAGGIAHDFNNLLTAIIGFCDLLLLRHKPGDPSFGDIQQIKQNSNRAANLVRQLLAFSRQQTLRPQVQDVTDILTELAHLLRRLIGVNIELNLVHGQDLGLVKVDSGQMEQVLVNMAVNARDAMPDGGSLTITTSHFHNEDSMTFGQDTMPVGDWIRIDVTDTGTGIPPDILARIFEPFFTTKDVGKGTGLGLATVYGIIRQTGGYLGVDSTVGKGTTFRVYLPCVTEEEAKEEIKETKETEEQVGDLTGSARILLVEDEDAVRTFSTRALKNKGYEVLTAENGEAGWDVFKDLDQPIDLLITDV
ncbi:MAG TPA: ATP-binding protein, partial [Alphaproteobacteria bacterium]|nr:ATP-binding protein [Alphaproteobacteria bacterium]